MIAGSNFIINCSSFTGDIIKSIDTFEVEHFQKQKMTYGGYTLLITIFLF